jgi:dihydrofolate synthase/folylpolyglutamate synthase
LDALSPRSHRRYATLDEWLAWFETLHPKKIDLGLDRIRLVLETLGIDKPHFAVITVAGTNGKGSCVAMLESIYRAAGYRVGAFTSPHLLRFNERIRFDGADATDAELIELFESIDAALGDVTLSYFESSAVAAILGFYRHGVDIAILEVGMGGRLDAVNALDADAALIVSIDLDHTEWLGPDREAIGREKAGIARPGRPVIVADPAPPASVTGAIAETGALGRYAGRDYAAHRDGDEIVFRDAQVEVRMPRPAFGGPRQIDNAAACTAVALSLTGRLPLEPGVIARGIGAARLAGRIDVHAIDGHEWVFDVAHNAAAAARLAEALAGMPPARSTTAVFGAMADKDLAAVLAPFIGRVDAWHVAPIESERSARPAEVETLLRDFGVGRVTTHAGVAEATHAARQSAAERTLVFGSFYTVGPALAALELYSAPHSAGDPNAWIHG